ncbi:MAG: DUF2284 domain-containing protein [Treponema sp.]|nr:DUF2284 domain-containing protein [Treponema sp.]MCL2251076.1 DUF2284 domain-containing protein [Treponema sp.]MCL2251655.1 DUF2284 domain-containing protein [Treponema sp.]
MEKNFIKDFFLNLKIPVHEWAVLPSSKIPFSPSLLDYCKTNACGNYNKSWVCPPACESFEKQREKILSYREVLVFSTLHKIEDSFDYEGMTKGRKKHTFLTSEIKEKLTDTPVFGAASCPICSVCNYPSPCLYPEKRIESVEAAGVDVTKLCKISGLKYNNGQGTVTFFSLVLLNN